MALSIEESINSLKAEIIAQDWRISPSRAEQLDAALSCLRQRFKNRKATHAMLVMAGSVLNHIKKGGGRPPETIDFIKEAMAHVVDLYEDLTYDPEKEDRVFKGLFKRFNKLKKIIRDSSTNPQPLLAKSVFAENQNETSSEEPEKFSDILANAYQPPYEPSDEKGLPPSVTNEISLPDNLSGPEVTKLISNLQTSLLKVEEVENTISKLLDDLLVKQKSQADEKQHVADKDPEDLMAKELPPEPFAEVNTVRQSIKACPATELHLMVIDEQILAIKSKFIALIKTVNPSNIKSYIKNSCVPLKDFSSFMQNLSCQFEGNLSKIKTSKLKKLSLPVLTPQGMGLNESPDEQATKLMILSNGNWHGAIFYRDHEQEKGLMVKFEKQFNGDISGIGHLEDGSKVLLLDSLSILRREGFLLMG